MIRTIRTVVVAGAVIVVRPDAAVSQSSLAGTVLRSGQPAVGAVVHLAPATGTVFPASGDTVSIDQAHLRFVPRVLAIQTGATVKFHNSDPIMHNVFSPSGRGAGFDLGTYPRTESRAFTFSNPGTFVVLCHVHPEMAAWVRVVPTPYHAVTDTDGKFSLDDVPEGTYQLRAWHRRREFEPQTVRIVDGRITDVEVVLDRRAADGEGR